MSELINIIILGIIEGVTEFIPVSSTGHLVLAGAVLGYHSDASKTFDIVIQLGAILAVIVLYWKKFRDVSIGLFQKAPSSMAFTRNIFLGFVPSLLVGAFAYSKVREMLESPTVVAWALIAGGIAILVIERLVQSVEQKRIEDVPWQKALGIGFVQCISMIPGVSRSGATIMGALLMGVDRKSAAEFSFFVAVPTMIAASAYSLFKEGANLPSSELLNIAIGFLVSFVVAIVVIKAFVSIVSRIGFSPFAWYRIILGVSALIWLNAK